MEGWVQERRSLKKGRGWVDGMQGGREAKSGGRAPRGDCAPGVVNMQVAYF